MKLSTSDKQWIGWLITVLLIVASTWIGIELPDLPPVPIFEEQALTGGTTNLYSLELADDLTVTDDVDIDGDIDVDGTANLDVVDIDGDVDLGNNIITNIGAAGTDFVASTGALNLAGELDMAGLLQLSFADLAISDGDTITPTYTVYALDTSGAVTITLAASADEGQLLILINDDANAAIIADTNLRSSDGNAITLAGAYDAVLLIYQDSEWLELLSIAGS